MQMHESSLKWEEFETSVFKIGFILRRITMLPYTDLFPTLLEVQGKYFSKIGLIHTV